MNQIMDIATEQPTILSRIKQETQKYHDAIEQNILGKRLMGGIMTEAEYQLYLKKFYGYHAALEARFRGTTGWEKYGIAIQSREKLPLLYQDLIALGMTEQTIRELPVCDIMPTITTLVEAFGALYVMEGSTLGGQIQARQVQKTLGLTAHHGIAYFSSYGASVGAMWKEFCTALLAISLDYPTAQDTIIATASETFQTLHRWLDY